MNRQLLLRESSLRLTLQGLGFQQLSVLSPDRRCDSSEKMLRRLRQCLCFATL